MKMVVYRIQVVGCSSCFRTEDFEKAERRGFGKTGTCTGTNQRAECWGTCCLLEQTVQHMSFVGGYPQGRVAHMCSSTVPPAFDRSNGLPSPTSHVDHTEPLWVVLASSLLETEKRCHSPYLLIVSPKVLANLGRSAPMLSYSSCICGSRKMVPGGCV